MSIVDTSQLIIWLAEMLFTFHFLLFFRIQLNSYMLYKITLLEQSILLINPSSELCMCYYTYSSIHTNKQLGSNFGWNNQDPLSTVVVIDMIEVFDKNIAIMQQLQLHKKWSACSIQGFSGIEYHLYS